MSSEQQKDRNQVPKLRVTSPAEDLYAFPQSPNITYSTGFIGCLKGEFEDNSLFTLWSDAAKHLKTGEFVSDINSVLNALKEKTLLNRKNMRSYCRSHSSAMMSGNLTAMPICAAKGIACRVNEMRIFLMCIVTAIGRICWIPICGKQNAGSVS